MHGFLTMALIAVSIGAVPARDSASPPKRLTSLSSALQQSNVDVGEWRDVRPSRCERRPSTDACKRITRSWSSLLTLQHAGRSHGIELWAIPQPSVASAKRLLTLLEESDEFGGTFGKAPEAHYRCHNTVLATVGTYRAPRPHDKVDKLVARWVADHCTSESK